MLELQSRCPPEPHCGPLAKQPLRSGLLPAHVSSGKKHGTGKTSDFFSRATTLALSPRSRCCLVPEPPRQAFSGCFQSWTRKKAGLFFRRDDPAPGQGQGRTPGLNSSSDFLREPGGAFPAGTPALITSHEPPVFPPPATLWSGLLPALASFWQKHRTGKITGFFFRRDDPGPSSQIPVPS